MEASLLDPRSHVDTPENVRLTFHLAGPGTRMGAYLLDLTLRWTLLFALASVLFLTFPVLGIFDLPLGIYLVGHFVLEWGYGCVFEGLWNGQTPGKRAFRLRVMKTEGYPIGFHEAVLRNLLRVADALPLLYGVGLITMMSSSRMQRLGDLVAGTMVVREDLQRLREELPGIRSVESIPPSSFRNAYRPSERTLDVIDGLFRRRDELGRERIEEIAGILASPLAQRLVSVDERAEARRHPGRFLLRVLASFHASAAENEASSSGSLRAAS